MGHVRAARELVTSSVDARTLVTASVLMFITMGATSCASVAKAQAPASPTSWLAVPASRFHVSSGRVTEIDDHTIRVLGGGVRAELVGDHSDGAELDLVYRGPSFGESPLGNGEVRRQLGLKLRAHDTCNVVYVMWHVEPTPGIYVSVKHNVGQSTHAQCGDRGYINLKPDMTTTVAPLRTGEHRTMRAWIEGSHLLVATDGNVVWKGTLPPETWTFDGPVGLRSDNAVFDVKLTTL